MNYQIVRNVIGKLMILLAFLMFLPLIVCMIYQEEFINYIAFLVPIALLLIIGVLFNLKQAENTLLEIIGNEKFSTFKIETKRSDKSFPIDSQYASDTPPCR